MTQTLFNLAEAVVKTERQWGPGQTREIWVGKKHRAYVSEGGRDGGGLLYLGLRNGKPGQQAQVICGFLDPLQGWIWALTDQEYREWVRRAVKLARGGK